MTFDITFLNDGHHLPADEQGLPALFAFILSIMVIFGGVFAYLLFAQRSQLGQMHLIVVLLGVSFTLQLVSVFCEYLHLARYEYDGKGLRWRHTWFAADFF